eukprot:5136232-Amphidinium_carterae.1
MDGMQTVQTRRVSLVGEAKTDYSKSKLARPFCLEIVIMLRHPGLLASGTHTLHCSLCCNVALRHLLRYHLHQKPRACTRPGYE